MILLLIILHLISIFDPPEFTERDYWYIANALMGECGLKYEEECIAIGWTILNRYEKLHKSIPRIVTEAYYGFNPNRRVSKRAIQLAKDLIKFRDPTDGCIIALSYRDVANLKIRIPPDYRVRGTQFWREWPVGKRYIIKNRIYLKVDTK